MKILKFFTNTCMPCRMVGKVLEGMNLDVESINATEDIAKVEEYNVCTTPTLIFLNENNKEVARTTGPVTASKINEILNTHNI